MRAGIGERAVSSTCGALGATRRGCRQWASGPDPAHDLRDLELARLMGDVHGGSRGIYGAPKVLMALRGKGVRTSRKRVARIMRECGWRGVTGARAKRPSGEKRASKEDPHGDLVKRRFSADGPNEARFADIAYVGTRQGWLHLAVVTDVWSRMVVGWSMGPEVTAGLAGGALKMAIARRHPKEGCIRHSGHGAQYMGLLPGRTMGDAGIGPPMGSVPPVGQRGHRVAHGRDQIGVRARAHLRQPRAGGARAVRLHGALLQQASDTLSAWMAEPCRVRGRKHHGGPLAGGLEPVNDNGADSSRTTFAASLSRMDSRSSATRSAFSSLASKGSWAWIALSLPATSLRFDFGTLENALRQKWTVQRW